MQTHTDRRSPSQVRVGHREGAEQGKVQTLTRFFHAHLALGGICAIVLVSREGAEQPAEPKREERKGKVRMFSLHLLVLPPV
jgi:hypothetical protein